MDLILSESRTIKLKLQLFVVTIISFITGLTQIQESSLLFVLPLFYLSFMCGYQSLIGFFIGLSLSTLITYEYIYIFICIGSLIILEFCMFFHSMRMQYVPYMLTLIAGIYYAYMQIDLYTTLLFVVVTYINMIIYLKLVPLFIHGNKDLLTHDRLKTLGVFLFICTLSLLQVSSVLMFILIRIIILIYIYHQCIDDILPALYYISLYILLESVSYQKDILSIMIPITFFYMIKTDKKISITSLYLLSHITLPFILEFKYQTHGFIIVVSALIFILLPLNKHKPLSALQPVTIENQLSRQVDSFCKLFNKMTDLFNQIPVNNHSLEYIGYIYEDMCENCSSQETCFNKKYGPNRLVKLMNKGLKENYDKEDHKFINEYCMKPKQYKQIIQSYKTDYKKIIRVQQEYQSMKKDIYHQFSLLNDVFHQFSNKLTQGTIEEKHILKHMIGHNFNVIHLKKYYETQSVYYIEIGLYEITKSEIINDFIPILETYINETLDIVSISTPMKKLGYTYIVLTHKTRYYTQHGIIQCSKDKNICGDSYEVFTMNEHQYFTLSDGMGQGEKASKDSLLTLDVFKQLIVNGISLKDTIQSINSLLKIKNRNDMFTTLDMSEINLSIGVLSIAKYGACPTYILRDNEVIELSLNSLPVGIISPLKTCTSKYQLKDNDYIFMISDGMGSSFKEFLEENKSIISDEHPKDITHVFMNMKEFEEKNDDMTLLTIKVCKQ